MLPYIIINQYKMEVVMPGFDRSGPLGRGPMTGRKSGLCTGNTIDNEFRGGAGGRGRGRMRGRGYGRSGGWDMQPYTGNDADTAMNSMKEEMGEMRKQIEALTEKLSKLQKPE
jgi:hypothetical protein